MTVSSILLMKRPELRFNCCHWSYDNDEVCMHTHKGAWYKTIVSMNPIMVDGTGMCGACRLTIGDQIKFACVDGPEFDGHLVNFDEAMNRLAMYKTQEGKSVLREREGDTHHHAGCECHDN